MKYLRDRSTNIPFSLHDSRIKQIDTHDDLLILKMDRIFQYTDDEEKWFPGTLEFMGIDNELCEIMIFNAPYGFEGIRNFSGRILSLEEYIEQYPNAEFEVITEGYCGYDTIFHGQIWQDEGDPLVGIMTIWNSGDIIYKV